MNGRNLAKRVYKVLLAWSLVAGSTFGVAIAAKPNDIMQFTAVQPTGTASILFANVWYIYGSGTIDQRAAERLKALIAFNKIPRTSMIFLDSLGGSLLGGLALGREIRAEGMQTYVEAADGMTGDGIPAGKPAVCASACTLAFLGGRFRYMDEKSVYAVHRFYFAENSPNDADAAQILSSTIVQYMRDMGVDPRLFTLSTGAGKSEVVIVNRQQLLAFNVINNGQEKPIWSIEAVPQGLYLRGEHITVWGDNKLSFLCGKNGFLAVSAIFPTRGQASLIAAQKADGLLLDGVVFKIPSEQIMGPTFENEYASLVFVLDPQDVERVLHAHTIGASMQIAYDAPTFSGIADFDFTDGLKKIGGFMTTCH